MLLKSQVNFYPSIRRYIPEYSDRFSSSSHLALWNNHLSSRHAPFTRHLSVMGSEVIRGDINHQQDSLWIYVKTSLDARLLIKPSQDQLRLSEWKCTPHSQLKNLEIVKNLPTLESWHYIPTPYVYCSQLSIRLLSVVYKKSLLFQGFFVIKIRSTTKLPVT
jgi:hypothetical protein